MNQDASFEVSKASAGLEDEGKGEVVGGEAEESHAGVGSDGEGQHLVVVGDERAEGVIVESERVRVVNEVESDEECLDL